MRISGILTRDIPLCYTIATSDSDSEELEVTMVTRVKVALDQPEYSALLRLAIDELRDPPDQLRHILRQELERRGLWPAPTEELQPERLPA